MGGVETLIGSGEVVGRILHRPRRQWAWQEKSNLPDSNSNQGDQPIVNAADAAPTFDVQAFANHLMRGGAPAGEAKAENATQQGTLQMVRLEDIHHGKRHRYELGDLAGLKESIQANGLLTPVTLTTEMELVSGFRRLKAHQELGYEQILAHVVDLSDPLTAQLEEDRCRQQLNPIEMYDWSETLREKLEDEAWKRRTFGKRIEDAEKKGRVDDLLAGHLGISRPTLRKIKRIMDASRANPGVYDDVVEALRTDRKVDRHYRTFLGRAKPEQTDGPKAGALLLEPDWQEAMSKDAKAARTALARLNAASFMAEGGLVLVPTSLPRLKEATSLVGKLGATWRDSLLGTSPEQGVWLVGVFGRESEIDEAAIKELANGCEGGRDEAWTSLASLTDYPPISVNLMQVVGVS